MNCIKLNKCVPLCIKKLMLVFFIRHDLLSNYQIETLFSKWGLAIMAKVYSNWLPVCLRGLMEGEKGQKGIIT